MKHSKVKHVFIIADSCYSGELAKIKFGPQVALPKSFTTYKSRKVLASGRKKVSDGVPGDHSPFAKYFLKMLKNNKDNFLTANDLINYTVNTVRYNPGDLDQEPVGGPIQGAGHELGEFLFFLKESGKPKKSYETYLFAGNRAFKYKKFKEAKGHYEKILQKFPNDTYAKRRIKRCDEINAKGISRMSVKGKPSYKIKNYDDADFKPALAVVVFLTNSRYGIKKQHIIDEKVRRVTRFLSNYKNFYTGWVSYSRTDFRLNEFNDEYKRQILISDQSYVDTADFTLSKVVNYINQKFANVNVLRGEKMKPDKLLIILDKTIVSSNSRFLNDSGYSERKLNIKLIDIREVVDKSTDELFNAIYKD
jgi:tetratricopeptide (TPR) repeat protein